MSGRWFGRRGRIVLLVGLLIAWGTVLYVTRTPGPRAPGGSARAASGPVTVSPAVPASHAASAPSRGVGNAVPPVQQR